MTSVSPGKTVGSMLDPVTFNLRVPNERKTSAASSHLRAWASLKVESELDVDSECAFRKSDDPTGLTRTDGVLQEIGWNERILLVPGNTRNPSASSYGFSRCKRLYSPDLRGLISFLNGPGVRNSLPTPYNGSTFLL